MKVKVLSILKDRIKVSASGKMFFRKRFRIHNSSFIGKHKTRLRGSKRFFRNDYTPLLNKKARLLVKST